MALGKRPSGTVRGGGCSTRWIVPPRTRGLGHRRRFWSACWELPTGFTRQLLLNVERLAAKLVGCPCVAKRSADLQVEWLAHPSVVSRELFHAMRDEFRKHFATLRAGARMALGAEYMHGFKVHQHL